MGGLQLRCASVYVSSMIVGRCRPPRLLANPWISSRVATVSEMDAARDTTWVVALGDACVDWLPQVGCLVTQRIEIHDTTHQLPTVGRLAEAARNSA